MDEFPEQVRLSSTGVALKDHPPGEMLVMVTLPGLPLPEPNWLLPTQTDRPGTIPFEVRKTAVGAAR
jgi:hypothetical protein